MATATCIQNKWYYTGEKYMDDYINYIESNKNAVLKSTAYFDSVGDIKPENRYYDLHAMGYLIRGYAKLQSDREKEAFEDFQVFASDLEKANQMNKKMYLLAAFISIKNNNKDLAKKYISLIEKDNSITTNDKKTVKQLKEFLETNEEDKNLNNLIDKYMIYKIITNYAYTIATKSDIGKNIKQDEYGQMLYLLPEKIHLGINQVGETISNTVDSLGSKAKDLFDNIFK